MTNPLPPRRAVLLSSHLGTIRTVSKAFGAAGVETRLAGAVDELPGSASAEIDLAVVDLDAAPGLGSEALLDLARARCPAAKVMAIAGRDARRRLTEVLASGEVVHALPKAPPTQPNDDFDGPDERDLFVALRRRALAEVPLFAGVAPYLAGAAPVHEILIGSTDEKEGAVAEVVALAERMLLQGELLRRIELTAEELVMNALFDAPVDEAGRRRFATLERTERVVLGAAERVRLRYGCDGRAFAIAVADPFGALRRETVTEHLHRALQPGGARPSHQGGGASVGLLLAFAAANQLVFSVQPGAATEVTAVIDVAGSNRASLARGTSVHFYEAAA